MSGTFADVLTGRPLQFTACSGVTVAPGVNRVVEPATDAFDVQDVVLDRATGTPARRGRRPRPRPPGGPRASVVDVASRRVLRVDAPTRSYLVVNENFNPGWQASMGGRGCRRSGSTGGSRPGCCPPGPRAW